MSCDDENAITPDAIRKAVVDVIGEDAQYIIIIPEQGMVVSSVDLPNMLNIFERILAAHKAGRYRAVDHDETHPKDIH